jgi:uncharacterized membrane protein
VYTFLKTLHVVAAVFLIGPLVVVPMGGLRAVRVGDLSAVRSAVRQTTLYGMLSLLVFAFGAAMIPFAEKITFGTPWVTISMTLFVVALGIVLGLVVPSLTKAATLLESGAAKGETEAHPELDAIRGRIAASSGVASLLLVVITVLMVVKPFG